jgi:hypothetical protein
LAAACSAVSVGCNDREYLYAIIGRCGGDGEGAFGCVCYNARVPQGSLGGAALSVGGVSVIHKHHIIQSLFVGRHLHVRALRDDGEAGVDNLRLEDGAHVVLHELVHFR